MCLRGKGPLLEEMQEHARVKMHNTPKRWKYTDIEAMSWIAEEVSSWKPHIIHGAVFEGTVMAGLAGVQNRGSKVILEETGDPTHYRSWRANLLLKSLASVSDAFVGVSPPIADYWRSLGVPQDKVYLIENGVEPIRKSPEVTSKQLRRSLGIDDNAFVVGSAGRIHDSHKRFSDLIKAVSLIKTRTDVHLLVVGDGVDIPRLQSLAMSLGLAGRVHFPGYQYNLVPYYSAMNVFALLSEQESFGLVVAEAMFCELPVVATRVGGMKFVVEDGGTGFLVDPYAPEQAAQMLESLIAKPGLAKRMGEAGRLRAMEKYSSHRYVKDVLQMYEAVVGAE